MREAVVVAARRTPIGKRHGSLSGIHPVDLSALVLQDVIAQVGLEPEQVDDVQWGCVNQLGDQSSNIARFAVLAAGWPESVPGVTINRACGSSQQALDHAAAAVIAGQADIVIAGGVESMSRVPLGATREVGLPYGPTVRERYGVVFNQGVGAELIAAKWGLSRHDLDTYAVRSHQLAQAAIDGGAFDAQLVPVDLPDGSLSQDEGIRPTSSVEVLATLPTPFDEDGVISAGNASQISDGAAALVVMTAAKADQLGIEPLVTYRAGAVAGADPVHMLTAPIPATEKVLSRAGLDIDDIGVFEVNEAFAPVPLAWLAETGADEERLNPLGGAIAVGHPLGASGAILMTRLIHHMRDNGIRYGLQTMCEAGGTANATVVELAA